MGPFVVPSLQALPEAANHNEQAGFHGTSQQTPREVHFTPHRNRVLKNIRSRNRHRANNKRKLKSFEALNTAMADLLAHIPEETTQVSPPSPPDFEVTLENVPQAMRDFYFNVPQPEDLQYFTQAQN
jgi:hypothetical protein